MLRHLSIVVLSGLSFAACKTANVAGTKSSQALGHPFDTCTWPDAEQAGTLTAGQCASWSHPLISANRKFVFLPLNHYSHVLAGWSLGEINDKLSQFVVAVGDPVHWYSEAFFMKSVVAPTSDVANLYKADTSFVQMQADGNAVFYASQDDTTIIGTTQTSHSPGSILMLSNDGELKVIDAAGKPTHWTINNDVPGQWCQLQSAANDTYCR